MHGTAHALNFEAVSNEAERVKGVAHDETIPLGAWTLAAGTPFVAATANIVGVGAVMTSANGLIWDAAADSGDIATLNWATNGHFRGIGGDEAYPSDTEGPQFKLLVLARKRGAGADGNATCALTGDLYWLHSDPDEAIGARGGDTALNHLTTPASVVMDAIATAATEEAFHWYSLDIGHRLEAETKVLKPYSMAQINLSVDAAPGTATFVEVIATVLHFRRHTAITPRARRVI